MDPGSPSIGRLCDALEAASARFVALLRSEPDPSAHAIGTWSVGETAAHVSMSGGYFLAVLRGEMDDPEVIDENAENNARYLATHPERRPSVLADLAEANDGALVAHARTLEGDPIVEPFAGAKVPASSALAVELGEVLVHGYDIARAARARWTIPRAEAALAVEGFVPLLPFIVDEERARGRRLRCELRIRGGARVVVALEGPTLELEPPSGDPVDCTMSVDPATFLLLTFRRVGLAGVILRGRVTAWGRRPWRAMSLQTVMKSV